MIIITPEKFNKFELLPSSFEYFSLNPEFNHNYQLKEVVTESLFPINELNSFIVYQKMLYATELPDRVLPNTLKYNLNFRFTETIFINSIKQKLNQNFNQDVAYINEFKKHKSLKIYLIYLYYNIKLDINLKSFLAIPFSLVKFFNLIFKKSFNLFLTNRSQAKNIINNLNIESTNILNSDNIFKIDSISLSSLILTYRILAFPFNIIDLAFTRYRYKDLFKSLNLSVLEIYFVLTKYNFSKVLRKILKFKLYSISNYGLSEALNLTSGKENNFLINHGVYYYDSNPTANTFWKFHSLTMIQSLNSKILSNNYKDLDFIKKNKLALSYKFQGNTLREVRGGVSPKNEKIILIADTLKSQNFLRPILYNNVFEYLDFINQICNVVPKDYEIIIRHRPNTIISEDFIIQNNKRLKASKNLNIYDDFLLDPIVVGYTSTVLFESEQLGLRSISFDPYSRDIEFFNFPLYTKTIIPSKRFLYNVKGKNNLKELLCKI